MTTIAIQNETAKRETWQFWIKALRPYPPHWIEDAFLFFARNADGKYPNPQSIIEIINKRKGG